MLRLVIPCSQRTRTAAEGPGTGKLVLAALLWAVVMALGVWDYYILSPEATLMQLFEPASGGKFPPCHLPKIYQVSRGDPEELLQTRLRREVLMPVVKVRANGATGSGVLLSLRVNEFTSSRETFVLTAAHVVGDNDEVQVIHYTYSRQGGTEFAPNGSGLRCRFAEIINATVIITDTIKDLALLQLTDYSLLTTIYSARLAPRNYVPYLFTEVYAVGCSLGLNPRPSEGIITSAPCHPERSEGSHNNRDSSATPQNDSVTYLEISAPVLPGNSGGGVFLKDTHELIGITVWVRVYRGQLITTMTGVVPIQQIYEFFGVNEVKPRCLP